MDEYVRHPNTQCSVCGDPIYRRRVELERSKGRAFCSRICYGKACRKEIPCVVCKLPILASANKKTCSRACANINRTGIKYKLNSPKDKLLAYKHLKIRLLDQRGKKCERCDYDKPEILQIHHKDHNHGNNDIKNLELICPNCHFEEHYLEKSWLKS